MVSIFNQIRGPRRCSCLQNGFFQRIQISMIWMGIHTISHQTSPLDGQEASWVSTETMRKLTTPIKPAVINLIRLLCQPGGDRQGFPCVLAMQYSRANFPVTGILLNPHISWTTWIISLKHAFSFCVTCESQMNQNFP